MKKIIEVYAANEIPYDVCLRILKKVIEQEEADRDEEEQEKFEVYPDLGQVTGADDKQKKDQCPGWDMKNPLCAVCDIYES